MEGGGGGVHSKGHFKIFILIPIFCLKLIFFFENRVKVEGKAKGGNDVDLH